MSDQAHPQHSHLSPQQQSRKASESTAGSSGLSLQQTRGAAVMCSSPFTAGGGGGGGSSSRDGRLMARSSRHRAALATTGAGQGMQQQQQLVQTQELTGRQGPHYGVRVHSSLSSSHSSWRSIPQADQEFLMDHRAQQGEILVDLFFDASFFVLLLSYFFDHTSFSIFPFSMFPSLHLFFYTS